MQRIVDRSEAKAERKRCPQMIAIQIEISIRSFGQSPASALLPNPDEHVSLLPIGPGEVWDGG